MHLLVARMMLNEDSTGCMHPDFMGPINDCKFLQIWWIQAKDNIDYALHCLQSLMPPALAVSSWNQWKDKKARSRKQDTVMCAFA